MDIIKIENLNSEELNEFARTNEHQLMHYNEPALGYFLAESPKVIERAIAGGYEPLKTLVDLDNMTSEVETLLSQFSCIPVFGATKDVLSQLTGYHLTRGIQCVMKRKTLPSVESVCQGATRIAVLEEVVNPINVGAIFRSAAALDIDGVILTEGCSDPLYRRSARVSMGTVFQIPWTYIKNWDETGLEELKRSGFKTVAMALRDDTVPIDDDTLNSERKIAIILGNEGYGLKDKTLSNCDYTVKIPMREIVDSLNVAAASAVAFWQLTESKRKS